MLITAWIVLVLLKLLVATIALRLCRVPLALAAGVGLALAQIGEFSFVLVQQAQELKLVGEQKFPMMLTLAVLSLLLTPFLVNASAPLSRWLSRGVSDKPEESAKPKTAADVRAVVVGYGPVGKTLTRLLRSFGIEPVVIDLNLATVERLKAIRIAAVYGDASRSEVLEAAGIRSVSFLLVTQPDQQGRLGVINAARRINPNLTVLVRARYLTEEEKLKSAGATEVFTEETTVAVSLAQRLLQEIGVAEEVVAHEAARIPDEISQRTGFTLMIPKEPRSPSSAQSRDIPPPDPGVPPGPLEIDKA
jgi:CPA2 family monovalent cation:H+ antiporter-2